MRLPLLPHKNLLLSLVAAIAVFLIAFFLTNGRLLFYGEQKLVVQTLPTTSLATDIDTDHDGLPDWEEKLYGSDMNNPDTDGDGTKDGDEVRIGRNPAVPNTVMGSNPPNDKLPYLEDPNIATSSTDMLGLKKEFFAKYLAEGSRNIKETTFQDLIKKVNTKTFAPQREIVSLDISSDNSAEGVKTYVNAFGAVIKKYLSQHMERSEDIVIQDALTKKDANSRAELQLFAVAYRNFAKDLLGLQVPSTLAKAHLLIVNGYQGMGDGLLGLENIQGDPLNGTASYEAYMKYRLDVVSGYAMIVAYVSREHMTFTADEPGYPFYWNTAVDKTTTS